MKKILLSAIVVGSFILYGFFQRRPAEDQTSIPVLESPIPTNSNLSVPTSIQTTQPTQTIQPSGRYKDGAYTGNVVDAFYGNIQVKTVIQNGQMIDVQFFQYPNGRDRSIAINTEAMPILRQEAIQTQSANVDIVSGATDSSQAFIESLTSAYTLTDITSIPLGWQGIVGRIDAKMIQEEIPDYSERLFYISGSHEMVESIKQVLRSVGIKNSQIIEDYFPGLV